MRGSARKIRISTPCHFMSIFLLIYRYSKTDLEPAVFSYSFLYKETEIKVLGNGIFTAIWTL